MSICVVYGSMRKGNSEILAEIALENVKCTRIYLRDKHIEPITDKQDIRNGSSMVSDDFKEVTDIMLNHQTVLFVTPLYWYGMSGTMKNFIDRWYQIMREQHYDFKEKMSQKKVYVIIVGGGAKMTGLPLVQQFKYIFDYLSITFAGYILGNAKEANEILRDQAAVFSAELLNQELLETSKVTKLP